MNILVILTRLLISCRVNVIVLKVTCIALSPSFITLFFYSCWCWCCFCSYCIFTVTCHTSIFAEQGDEDQEPSLCKCFSFHTACEIKYGKDDVFKAPRDIKTNIGSHYRLYIMLLLHIICCMGQSTSGCSLIS